MARTHKPPARLVGLAVVSLGLVSGLMIHAVSRADAETAAGGADRPTNELLAAESGQRPAPVQVEADSPAGTSTAWERVSERVAGPVGPRAARLHARSGRTIQRICRVTAYCDRGLTASGVPSGLGQCAAPESIPLGSKVYIPELKRTFVVTDRTHERFRRSTVDIFIPSAESCRKFGRRFLECEFTLLGV